MVKQELLEKYGLRRESIPGHVAIIMDGNGRWAKARHMPRTYGHKKGAERVK
ncbi:MAG: undecaprenyl diphosphate synthase family protein, partial [Clostridiales bacterium]|nr:undecaprenyl diphosphate synthase family protein [Clostridiales bacterium]